VAGGAVDGGVVLDIGPGADDDPVTVASEHGAEPDPGPVSDGDIAEEGGIFRNEDLIADAQIVVHTNSIGGP